LLATSLPTTEKNRNYSWPLVRMTVSAQRALWCGFRFNPTAEEAISVYLRRWVAGEPLPDTEGIVYEAEVYNSEPDDLAGAFNSFRCPKPRTISS
jgi:hypothetical protein